MTQLHAQPAAGWYADPSGQHEARYWDGERWTDRVANRGIEHHGPDTGPVETPGGPVAGDPPVVAPVAPEVAPAPIVVDDTPEPEPEPEPLAPPPPPVVAVEAPIEAAVEVPIEAAVEMPVEVPVEVPVEPPPPPTPEMVGVVPGGAVELPDVADATAAEPPAAPFVEPAAVSPSAESPVDSPFAPGFSVDSPVDSAFAPGFAVESPVDSPFAPGFSVVSPVDSPVDPPSVPVVDVTAFAAPTAAPMPVAPVPPVVEAPVVTTSGPAVGWYPDPAGRHEVRYWDGSRWTERVADNGVESTESPAADVLEVAAGAITADPAGPSTGGAADWPADWYPDPTGRHEVRYFDGTAWTEHVANNGLSALDPITDGAPVATDAAALAASIVPAVSTMASPNATTVEAAEAAFAAALAPTAPAEQPEVTTPEVLSVRHDWAARPNALVGWIVVVGAGILGVGSLGPWAKATAPVVGEVTQNGMNGDGRFMLALAVLLVATGIGLIVGRFGRIVAFSALSLGTLAAIVCAVDMARITDGNYGLLQGTADATAAAGVGLWACLVGAIVCIAGGIVAVTHR